MNLFNLNLFKSKTKLAVPPEENKEYYFINYTDTPQLKEYLYFKIVSIDTDEDGTSYCLDLINRFEYILDDELRITISDTEFKNINKSEPCTLKEIKQFTYDHLSKILKHLNDNNIKFIKENNDSLLSLHRKVKCSTEVMNYLSLNTLLLHYNQDTFLWSIKEPTFDIARADGKRYIKKKNVEYVLQKDTIYISSSRVDDSIYKDTWVGLTIDDCVKEYIRHTK